MKRTFLGTALLAPVLLTAALAQSSRAAATSSTPSANSPSSAPASTPAASAATTPVPPGGGKVGIIEIQQAIMATNEGSRDLEALNKKFQPKDTELRNLGAEIESLQKQLNTQGDKMNEEARATLMTTIQNKKKTLDRSSEDARSDYDSQLNEIMGRILQKMYPVIEKYAKTNGYGILIDSSRPWPQGPVLWANTDVTGVDISKSIVDAYNAQSGVAAPAGGAKPSGTAGAADSKPSGAGAKPSASTSKPQ